jgi:hypothetical protein
MKRDEKRGDSNILSEEIPLANVKKRDLSPRGGVARWSWISRGPGLAK